MALNLQTLTELREFRKFFTRINVIQNTRHDLSCLVTRTVVIVGSRTYEISQNVKQVLYMQRYIETIDG